MRTGRREHGGFVCSTERKYPPRASRGYLEPREIKGKIKVKDQIAEAFLGRCLGHGFASPVTA